MAPAIGCPADPHLPPVGHSRRQLRRGLSRYGLLKHADATPWPPPGRQWGGVWSCPGPLVKGHPAPTVVSARSTFHPVALPGRTRQPRPGTSPYRRCSPSGHPRAHEGGPVPSPRVRPGPVGVPTRPPGLPTDPWRRVRCGPSLGCVGTGRSGLADASDRIGAGRSDQGKPVARRGRKATGLAADGLPSQPGCRGGTPCPTGMARTGSARMPRHRRRLDRVAGVTPSRSSPRARSSPC